MMPDTPLAVTLADIEAAAARLAGHAVLTPLIEDANLTRRHPARLLIKAETLQRTGSFKFRGAFNRMRQLDAGQRQAGVVAFSSGNHGQGVAAAARLLGTTAVVVMPDDAPAIKVERTRAYGAEIRLYDRQREDREAIARSLAAERNLTVIPPYDDPAIIAGQGTIGLELCAQARALGATLDLVLVASSGGGLASGIAMALAHHSPDTEIVVVEPEGFDDIARSLITGNRETNAPGRTSLCDALMSPNPGILTLPILRRRVSRGVTVTDSEVEAAMAYAFSDLKLVVEPGGAATLAAVLAGKVPVAGRTVAVVCSGGNVDPVQFSRILASAAR